VTGRRYQPSPYLMRRIAAEVADPKWCGGLRWAELADALNVREFDRAFIASVWACRRRGQVDMCGGYIVAVVHDETASRKPSGERPTERD
jgi:hypothetical protein